MIANKLYSILNFFLVAYTRISYHANFKLDVYSYTISMTAFFFCVLSSTTLGLAVLNQNFSQRSYAIAKASNFSLQSICIVSECKFIYKVSPNRSITYYGLSDKNEPFVRYEVNNDINEKFIKLIVLENGVTDYYPGFFDRFIVWMTAFNTTVNGLEFFLDYSETYDFLVKILLVGMGLGYAFFFLSNLMFSERKIRILKDLLGKTRVKAEQSRQMMITESLHHEFSPIIKALKIIINDLYKVSFPCTCENKDKNNLKGICMLAQKKLLSKEEYEEMITYCPIAKHGLKRETDKKLIDYYEKFNVTLDRLDNILVLLRAGKEIRKSMSSDQNVYDTIRVAIDLMNVYLVNKMQVHFNIDKPTIEKLKTINIKPITLSNPITTLITNASEANATDIYINVALKLFSENPYSFERPVLYIEVKDNGVGIRNHRGQLEKNPNRIFELGYSTKTNYKKLENDNRKNFKLFGRFLDYAGYNPIYLFFKKLGTGLLEINTHTIQQTQNFLSDRGTGLSVNRDLIRNAGGDLYIKETSETGTVFVIRLKL